jgi:hypothetical protein
MSGRIISALAVFLIGLGYISVPRYVFPICEFAGEAYEQSPAMGSGAAVGHAHGPMEASGHSEGGHMACWYTWRAEIGNGLVVMAGALLLLFSGSSGFRKGIRWMLAFLAIAGALYPTVLIGVCPGAAMPCRTGTLPALMILSGLLLVISLAGVFWPKKGSAHD